MKYMGFFIEINLNGYFIDKKVFIPWQSSTLNIQYVECPFQNI